MPNHVTHRIVVSGPPSQISRFRQLAILDKMTERPTHWSADREFTPEPYTTFDFNAFITMPECLRDSTEDTDGELGVKMIIARSYTLSQMSDLGIFAAEQWINHYVDEGVYADRLQKLATLYLAKHPEIEEAGRAQLRRLAESGYTSWYPWSIAKWGTKWGAYSFTMIDEGADSLEFKFDTAWSPPIPVFEKMAENFPLLLFRIVSFDEGWNFACEGYYGNGVPSDELPAYETSREDHDTMARLFEEVYGYPHVFEPDDEEDQT